MPAQLVASPLADMNATGTGTIESQEYTAAAHTDITHEFRISLAKTHDLFGAFSWSDVDTEGNVDVSSGQTNFNISLDQAKFEAALAYVIRNALGGKANSTFSLVTNQSGVSSAQAVTAPTNLSGADAVAETILDREVRLEVEDELDANGVLEYLEGDSLGDFSLSLDASGGAADMYDRLSEIPALRNLFLQIPNRTSEVGETDASGSRLPVKEGDQVVFVFSVSPSVTITQVTENADAANNAVSETPGAPEDLSTANMPMGMQLTTGTRKIAFVVEVTA